MVTKRMYEVEKLFLNEKAIICENRTNKLFLKNVLVQMKDGWSLRDHIFENPEYFKVFIVQDVLNLLKILKKVA